MCGQCARPIKARGMCKHHYELWLADPQNAARKVRRAEYPVDDDLVAMFAEHQSFSGVARVLGIRRESLRDYFKSRAALEERCRVHLRPRLSAEQREANLKASRRQWRLSHPEQVKENKRRWAGNRSSEDVRKWNRHNAQQRAALLPKLSPEEALESHEYEQILLSGPCAYCGVPATTIDHIVPVFDGGTDTWDNKCGACHSCNSSKRDKNLLDFLLWSREKEMVTC